MWHSVVVRRAPIVGIVVGVIAASVGLTVAAPTILAAECAWTPVSAPNPGRQITALTSIDGSVEDLWMVGGAKSKGVPYRSLAMHLTPDGWNVISTPNIKDRHNLFSTVEYVGADDVWAVGGASTKSGTSRNLIEHWDGTSWTRVAAPTAGRGVEVLSAVDAAPPGHLPVEPIAAVELWAVGQSAATSGGGTRAQIAHYDGTSWQLQTGPALTRKHALASVRVISESDVWAVGAIQNGDEARPLAMHFDGAAWTVVPTPSAGAGSGGSQLTSIAGNAADDLWAVGTQGNGVPLVMHWDGTTWSLSGDVHDAPGDNALVSVSTDVAGDVWAAGFSVGRTSFKTLIQHRTAGAWSTQSTPNPSAFNFLFDITAVPGGAVWAVGYQFNETATRFRNLVLRCG